MVIQRWQSVLLLMAAAVMGCFTFLSIGDVETPGFSYDFSSMGFKFEGEPTDGAPSGYLVNTWYFFTLSLMSAILPLITIFLYKNMKLQRTLCLVGIMFIIATATVGGILGYTCLENATIRWSEIACAPILAVLAMMFAYRRIGHDMALLRSADRIR